MGLLSNLWYGKNHEQWDQFAAEFADALLSRIREYGDEGQDIEVATNKAIRDVAVAVARMRQAGELSLHGYARMMTVLPNAIVMRGGSRGLGNNIRRLIRSHVTDIQQESGKLF